MPSTSSTQQSKQATSLSNRSRNGLLADGQQKKCCPEMKQWDTSHQLWYGFCRTPLPGSLCWLVSLVPQKQFKFSPTPGMQQTQVSVPVFTGMNQAWQDIAKNVGFFSKSLNNQQHFYYVTEIQQQLMGQVLLSTSSKQRKNDHQNHSKVSKIFQSILKQSLCDISNRGSRGIRKQ